MGQLFVTVCGVVDWSIFWAALPSRDAQRLEYYLIRIHRRERRAKGRACACNHARVRTTTGWSDRFGAEKPTATYIDVGLDQSTIIRECAVQGVLRIFHRNPDLAVGLIASFV